MMTSLHTLLAALDQAEAAKDEAFKKVYAARGLPIADRVSLDLDYKRALRAYNAAEDAYSAALRDAIATEAA